MVAAAAHLAVVAEVPIREEEAAVVADYPQTARAKLPVLEAHQAVHQQPERRGQAERPWRAGQGIQRHSQGPHSRHNHHKLVQLVEEADVQIAMVRRRQVVVVEGRHSRCLGARCSSRHRRDGRGHLSVRRDRGRRGPVPMGRRHQRVPREHRGGCSRRLRGLFAAMGRRHRLDRVAMASCLQHRRVHVDHNHLGRLRYGEERQQLALEHRQKVLA